MAFLAIVRSRVADRLEKSGGYALFLVDLRGLYL